jgi:hypothetical protein
VVVTIALSSQDAINGATTIILFFLSLLIFGFLDVHHKKKLKKHSAIIFSPEAKDTRKPSTPTNLNEELTQTLSKTKSKTTSLNSYINGITYNGHEYSFNPIKQDDKGNWIMNPESVFPITLLGEDEDIANELRARIDNNEDFTDLIAKHNLKFKELESYKKKLSKAYEAIYNDLLSSKDSALSELNDLDRQEIIDEIKIEAFSKVDVGLEEFDDDIFTIITSKPEDITYDDQLVNEYDQNTLNHYVYLHKYLNKTKLITKDNYNRHKYESLNKIGLALRGKEIELSECLNTLKLEELNNIAKSDKKFGRKNTAIAYILENTEATQRAENSIPFLSLFQLLPLPGKFAHIDMNKLEVLWDYHAAEQRVITITLECVYQNSRNLAREKQSFDGTGVKLRDFSIISCGCSDGKSYCNETFTNRRPPRLPFKFGCSCTLDPFFD